MSEETDPITLEVLWSRFRGIPREMGTHLSRTAFSAVIKYAKDFSTGLFTRDGRLISQGVYAPGHLGSMPFMVKTILEEYYGPDEWAPGDVVITNDPNINSGHLPDIFAFIPVFFDNELHGFCVVGGHHLDVGGVGVASYSMYATDLYAEGLQIPPVKIHDNGTLNEDLMAVVLKNSRVPRKIRGDLRAQISTAEAGRDLYQEILEEYGSQTVSRYVEEMLSRSEQRTREAIDEIPDGAYTFADDLDGFDDPLPVRVEVTVDGSDVFVDFAGTADQVPGHAINSPWQYTFAYTMLAIKSMIDPNSPQTEGTINPITMKAPEGSILNVRLPAPVGSRQVVCDRVVSTIAGALNDAIPGEAPAHGGQPNRQMFKFTDSETGTQQVLFDGHYGGAGGHPDRDGFPAVAGTNNLKNTPVEAIEAEHPIIFSQYQLVQDSGGAGQYRGGNGTVRDYEFESPVEIQLVNERFKSGPHGVRGGWTGATAGAVLNPGRDDERQLTSKEELQADAGDVLRIFTAGGGGYGKPAARDPSAIRADVSDGLVSREAAAADYGFETEPVDD